MYQIGFTSDDHARISTGSLAGLVLLAAMVAVAVLAAMAGGLAAWPLAAAASAGDPTGDLAG